ncbi:UDP-N-acetylglucosamine 1-carboxyvinyltransferase [Fervidicella metallireducens AeB]|uniref:UDP-N-acetylglucosamine 1-carboxyvinyltransferase n=1 Tax=Fervidicella metallireducens AeB TaxID=1403537 RepID=A0A017RZ14_9CLOT|nr:UDP-N-acetylglucosamine 1-carboxyvinyltransferase [Fervidicella metallireducens]EYE89831.1 UDP-N-acetylglucosamine 1-carboxyvinyltransferase [Fervidicella metallireducens AeB]
MEKIKINGGNRLTGKVKISAAKNSVLPIIAAALLSPYECILEDIPLLDDVDVICNVMHSLGAAIDIERNSGSISIKSDNINILEPPYELVRRMRASFLVMGPMLSRFGRIKISLPGGCNIGTRPIDLHLKGFAALGAEVTMGHGYVEAKCNKLKGAKIYLDFPSVGATENIMMAAVLADGETTIENAAEEPEIVDLANFLNSMGASIIGAGTDTVKICGVKELNGTKHQVIPDRIEAGTYMVAAALTHGDVIIENIILEHIRPMIAKLNEAGITIIEEPTRIRVIGKNRPKAVDIKTMPYPGFPTDMQAQFMALMSIAEGTSIITETVFENRFMHVTELKRMSADIKIDGRSAVIEGKNKLTGAKVKATDLRAGAALILAGLVAEGTTEIFDVHHIDRGYVDVVGKFKLLGADIERITE